MADAGVDGRVIAFGPAAQALVRRIGGDGVLVLFDLLTHGQVVSTDAVVVTTGYRAVARRVGLSKDTVGRQIAVLVRCGVIKRLAAEESADGFPTPTYELRLTEAGVEVSDLVELPGGLGTAALQACSTECSAHGGVRTRWRIAVYR